MRNLISLLFAAGILLFFPGASRAQLTIKQLPYYNISTLDSSFTGLSKTRQIIDLRKGWVISPEAGSSVQYKTSIPVSFENSETVVLTRNINFNGLSNKDKRFILNFDGVSYAGEILINDMLISKLPVGNFPFEVEIPADIISKNGNNKLTIKIYHEIDAKNSIPVKQSFMLEKKYGGIIRDIYLTTVPLQHFSVKLNSVNLSQNNSKADISLNVILSDGSRKKSDDGIYRLNTRIQSPGGQTVAESNITDISFNSKKEFQKTVALGITSPALWSPQQPNLYKVTCSLLKNDSLIDISSFNLPVFSLRHTEEGLLLNNSPFGIQGVTYQSSYAENGVLASYKHLEADFRIMKEMGVNAIRFNHSLPHPYALKLCTDLGILAFTDIPLNSIPEQILVNQVFSERANSYVQNIISSYRNYPVLAGIGLGGSYLSSSEDYSAFISNLGGLIKRSGSYITFASFLDSPETKIKNLDLYGLSIVNRPSSVLFDKFRKSSAALGKHNVFFADVTYATFNGSTNGYKNPFSYEAQAKFFEEVLVFASQDSMPGLFINSMFDYRGEFSPLFSGYSPDNILQIGITDEARNTNRLSYKIVSSYFNSSEIESIPLGTVSDDTPLFFIMLGLGLILLTGILINSRRKFREDAMRALLRPYNFYSDIRDQRILSGFHSNFLLVVITGSISLLICIMLFYFKNNISFEKSVIAFGSEGLASIISKLAWNPAQSYLYIYAFTLVYIFSISVIVKFASFFVKNRVLFSSIYYMVTWSLLPYLILIAAELFLYKVLIVRDFNMYIYSGLILFSVWMYQRLIKGIYVLFDVRPAKVYFFSILFIFVSWGSILLYFHFTNSTIYYLNLVYKQFISG